ncbi:LysR family transcriptional regulator [Pontibacter sp. JAM-7]|uniref:LysR family transcriptional regulator n=1 Tax=Pontibacter sp. JAM-7 TaxID=3366581 RepID=UPI003AF8A04B
MVNLKTFVAVVESGGVQAASRVLNTVQSNVTARIRRLEEELHASLFYRSGRSLKLTPAGNLLLDYAEKLLHLEQQAVQALHQMGSASGELRIGAMESFAAGRLPGLLQALRRRHPTLQPRVNSASSAELIDAVLEHRLDCAFVGGPVEHELLDVAPVVTEKLVLVSAKEGAVEDTFIMFRPGCAYRQRAEAWLQERGKVATQVLEMGTQEGILGCVAVGLGMTMLPQHVVEQSAYFSALKLETLPARYSAVPTLLISHRDAISMLGVESIKMLIGSALPVWESVA